MNDFDDKLSELLQDDGFDSSAAGPDLESTIGKWRQRRTRRMAAAGGVASVLMLGVGLGAFVLAPNRDADRIVDVSDSAATTSLAPDTTVPASVAPVSTIPTTEPVVTEPVVTEPVTIEPAVTEPPVTEPVESQRDERAAIDVNDSLVGDTYVVDSDNRLEIRGAGGEVLWEHRYCDVGVDCSATVQTATPDDVWIVVNTGSPFERPPETSTLQRISIAGGDIVVEHEAEPGSVIAAGQPTPAGLLIASGAPTQQSPVALEVFVLGEDGRTVLADDADNVEVSADGRFVAVTAWNPPESYGRTELTAIDLVSGRSNDSVIQFVTASPIEWSSDGAWLIVTDTWEDPSDSLLDPWAVAPADELVEGSLEPGSNASRLRRQQLCFIDAASVAGSTWDSPYAEGSLLLGSVEVIDVASGSVTSNIDVDTFGNALVCHRDGGVTIAVAPLRTETFEFDNGDTQTNLVIDHQAPVELVRIQTDGSQAVLAAGDLIVRTLR